MKTEKPKVILTEEDLIKHVLGLPEPKCVYPHIKSDQLWVIRAKQPKKPKQ